MAGGDGSGPNSKGPMTGRGAGFCSGNNAPGFTSLNGGTRSRFRDFSRGMGRGFRSPWTQNIPQFSAKNETEWLEQQSIVLENQLKSIKERLGNLVKSKK